MNEPCTSLTIIGVSGEGEMDFIGREIQIFLDGGPSTTEVPEALRLACFQVTGSSM